MNEEENNLPQINSPAQNSAGSIDGIKSGKNESQHEAVQSAEAGSNNQKNQAEMQDQLKQLQDNKRAPKKSKNLWAIIIAVILLFCLVGVAVANQMQKNESPEANASQKQAAIGSTRSDANDVEQLINDIDSLSNDQDTSGEGLSDSNLGL